MIAAAAALGLALFAGPWHAVAESSRFRPFAPLAGFSALCAAAAALIAATAQVALLPAPLHQPVAFAILGPPSIAVAPWAAGELCQGPSRRQDLSAVAAVIAAYLVTLLVEIVSGSLLLASFAAASAATAAYLCTRGETT
jgi:hypothetical protein